jgi:ATP-dependent exoDNAse (exonuclease V) alpha subunit
MAFERSIILNREQKAAAELLEGPGNLFLTGAAGTGKSHLIRLFLKDKDPDAYPLLASTGAAAILIGGRTFHSYFGIGILEGGYDATLARALKNRKLAARLKKAKTVIIDEVSMLSGTHVRIAEEVARRALKSKLPWGGLRVITVGDFAQLPPVNVYGRDREWAFQDPVWDRSEFRPVPLREIMRSKDADYLSVLADIRLGEVTRKVREFLDAHTHDAADFESELEFTGTRLFARRDRVEQFNLSRLAELDGPSVTFTTEFTGNPADVERFKKNVPIPEVLQLRPGALVMFRQNDTDGRWVNGSLGTVNRISDDAITVALLTGPVVETEKTDFTMLDADGKPVAKAHGFPLQLAWGLTIHKAQGTTLNQMRADIRGLWEPGQAYVALSRVKNPRELSLDGWTEKSIFMDPAVRRFYEGF